MVSMKCAYASQMIVFAYFVPASHNQGCPLWFHRLQAKTLNYNNNNNNNFPIIK